MDSNDPPKKFLISKEPDLCEECGNWKPVLIRMKWRYMVAQQLREIIDNLASNPK